MASDVYTHGHHESVLRSHRWRTAENSAGYLLPRLRPGLDLLDVGCGPGTITLDLAARVAPGRVVGIDAADDVVAEAERSNARGVEFRVGDVYELDFEDESFDVVHAHQVLQHLTDPIAALREAGRVLRSGGTLAVRDSDYGAFAWAPADPRLDRWMELYQAVTRHNRAEPNAGRYLLGWVRAAGFAEVNVSSSTWTFADDEARGWWGALWAERATKSGFATQAVAYGYTNLTELAAIAEGFRDWSNNPDGYFCIPHGEILATLL
jgi:ubiquinone/menaquinone biosynthesis C-methylase UbiE